MKKLLFLLVILVVVYLYLSSNPTTAASRSANQASRDKVDNPHDFPANEQRAASGPTYDGSAAALTETPANIGRKQSGLAQWWAQNGGLAGVVSGLTKGVTDRVNFILFGLPTTQVVPPDLTKHFSKVEDATVTVEGNDEGGLGATGFIVRYQGKTYIATNIHVLDGVAEKEAGLTWYEGPTRGQLTRSRLAGVSGSYNPAGGGRDARYERRKIAFHTFAIPGRRTDPSFLGFMAASDLPAFKTRDGLALKVGRGLLLSRSRDVALVPVETQIEPLEFSKIAPKDQENVFLVSNPEDKRTVYLVRGSVKAIGPDRLEVRLDGKGVGGMSGSPVVSAKSGSVIGIFTYSWRRADFDPEKVIKERPEDAWGASSASKGGEFAFRLDNLSDLFPITWDRFCWEVGVLQGLHERTRNVLYASEIPIRWSDSTVALPHDLRPDFNNFVPTVYSSTVASLRGLSESKDRKQTISKLDAYRRQLQHALEADLRQLSDLLKQPPLTVPYLVREAEDSIDRDQQIVSEYVRRRAGALPGRGNGW
jgi:hypothetical protein